MAVLIDTDVLIDRERGRALEDAVAEEERAISVITVSELLHGVHRASGATRTRRRAVVEQLLSAFDPIPITEPVARVHADAWAQLAARGATIGSHDLWIAATAIAHGLDLVTRNAADLGRVAGLQVRARFRPESRAGAARLRANSPAWDGRSRPRRPVPARLRA